MKYGTEEHKERHDLKRYTLDQLRRSGARRISFEHCIYDGEENPDRGIQIPMAVLGKDGRVLLAVRFRRKRTPKDPERKTRRKRGKTVSKRSQLIAKITGCQVITIRSMSDAVKLPEYLSKLNIPLH